MIKLEKRKRVVLTMEEKLEVILDRDAGEQNVERSERGKFNLRQISYLLGLSVEKIATKYNIGASTASEICKRRTDIEDAVEKDRLTGKIRKTLKDAMKPQVEIHLAEWYKIQKERYSIIPSNKEIIEKAKEINADLRQDDQPEDWNPSSGWLARFKDRFSITSGTTRIYQPAPEEPIKQSWNAALDAAEFLLEYINGRDFPLKDVITVRMIRDKIAAEDIMQNTDFE